MRIQSAIPRQLADDLEVMIRGPPDNLGFESTVKTSLDYVTSIAGTTVWGTGKTHLYATTHNLRNRIKDEVRATLARTHPTDAQQPEDSE